MVTTADDPISLGEGAVQVAARVAYPNADVGACFLVDGDAGLVGGIYGVHHRRQHLIVDLDQLQSVPRLV